MYTIRRDNDKDMNYLQTALIQQQTIYNDINPSNNDNNDNDNNINYDIAFIKNILKDYFKKDYYKNIEYTKIIQLNSSNRLSNSDIYNAKFDISTIGLKNIVKCDLIKAVIPKTRQLLHQTNNYNGEHSIQYCYSNNTSSGINLSNAALLPLVINNSNYSVSELEDIIQSEPNFAKSIIDLDSTTSHTDKSSNTSLGNVLQGYGTLLGHSTSESASVTKVIVSMSSKIANILGFTTKTYDNPFEKLYSIVNHTNKAYKIRLSYDDSTSIESNEFSIHTAYSDIETFLNILNTSQFELIYFDNKFQIINNVKKILNKIEILEDGNPINSSNNVLSNIIGISTVNVNLDLFEKYESKKKYLLEFNKDTPNDGSTLAATGKYHGALISKHPVHFIDTHYIHFSISELGSLQPIILHTKNKKKEILHSVDMNENYQNIIYYRSHDIDLESDRFTPIGLLNQLNIMLYDDNGHFYNLSNDWCITLRFTMISQKEYDESFL